jgi:DNA-directed RNA polymerase specialized sigma24 family protein
MGTSVREPHAMEWADQRPSPEEYALAQERQAITARLLDGLPVSYRRVVLLRDVEGLSTSAAAEFLGVSIGCVKSRLHRARALLRQQPFLSPIASRTLQCWGPVRTRRSEMRVGGTKGRARSWQK